MQPAAPTATCHVAPHFSPCSRQDPCLPLCLAGWAWLQGLEGSLVSAFHFDSGTLELETCVSAPGFTWGVGIGTHILMTGCQVLSSVLVCFSVASTNTIARGNPIKGRLYFTLQPTVHCKECQGGAQSRGLEAGVEAEAIKEHYSLSCSSLLLNLLLLYHPGPPEKGWCIHSVQASPHQSFI